VLDALLDVLLDVLIACRRLSTRPVNVSLSECQRCIPDRSIYRDHVPERTATARLSWGSSDSAEAAPA
jgi:hypothetical protein